MSAFSKTVQAAIANWVRGTAMPSAPSTLYLALSTTPVADDGTQLTEPSGGYSRQAVTLGAPVHTEGAGTVVSNTNALVFGPATATWGSVIYAAVLDQAGNVILKGPIPAPRSCAVGDTISLGIGVIQLNVK
jgi:hypothetical protein